MHSVAASFCVVLWPTVCVWPVGIVDSSAGCIAVGAQFWGLGKWLLCAIPRRRSHTYSNNSNLESAWWCLNMGRGLGIVASASSWAAVRFHIGW